MPFNIKYEESLHAVYVQFTGSVDIQERIMARDEVAILCKKHQAARAIIDMAHCQIAMTMDDIIRFSTSFDHTFLPEGIRIAGIIAKDDDENTRIESLSSTHGVNLKFFYNEAEARQWLTAIPG